MDELSARILEKYEAWKVCRGAVDELMDELRDGPGDTAEINRAIEAMREAWRQFEREIAPRLRRGSR
jgi:hypothetical protein